MATDSIAADNNLGDDFNNFYRNHKFFNANQH